MILVILIALALAGVALIAFGLRGRRVGEEPRCRRCEYDLTGAPPDSTRCPECGADLRAPRAVVTGAWRRRWRAGAIGLCLGLLAALGLAAVATKADWRDQLPSAYLLWEARSGTAASRVDAIDRLIARDNFRALPAGQRDTLARAIVALQRDPAKVWKGTWGDWAASRAVEGTLPGDVFQPFFDDVFAGNYVSVRPVVVQGEGPYVRIGRTPSSLGLASRSILAGEISTRNLRLTIDGVERPIEPGGFVSSSADGTINNGGGWSAARDAVGPWRDLALGGHAVEYAVPLKVWPAGSQPQYGEEKGAPPPLAQVMLSWRGTVTVVPKEGDGGVKLIDDPALADAIRRALGEPKLRLPEKSNYSTMLDMQYGPLPCDVAFDVFVRQGDGPEQRLTSLARSAKDKPGGHGYGVQTPRLEPGTCELIFRASREAARSTLDVFAIWDGEVRVAGAAVTRDEPYGRRTTTTRAATTSVAP